MSKIVAGIDVSGNPQEGNYKFMAIVIGTIESIGSIIKDLDNTKIHMNQISNKKTQNAIISKLKFNNDDCITFCIRIDRDIIVEKIQQMRRTRQKNISKTKIIRAYNYTLWRQIQDKITNYLSKHNYSLQDIIFQCDGDCKKFVIDNNLTYTDSKETHMLSDIVAWANNRGKEPNGVTSLDLRKTVESQLKNILQVP